jgi:hypothetical protein
LKPADSDIEVFRKLGQFIGVHDQRAVVGHLAGFIVDFADAAGDVGYYGRALGHILVDFRDTPGGIGVLLAISRVTAACSSTAAAMMPTVSLTVPITVVISPISVTVWPVD